MRRIRIRKKDKVKGIEIEKLTNKEFIKTKTGKILCIILHEGKGSTWYWLPDNQERFSINENTYFKVDNGTYLKDTIRFMLFLEGISIPINHGYIEKEEIEKTIHDNDTNTDKTIKINKIKGLNFDSKVIDILLNRHLADEFTKTHMDLPNLVIIILLVATLITSIVSIAVEFL